ncbi:MAG: FAD-dependent oxidoreductase [Akkermansiaceae bacterium]
MKHHIETSRRNFFRLSGGVLLGSWLPGIAAAEETMTPDVCVYGATASGIMAAVAAAREGASVVIVEPSRWLGGMTGGGLMHIDWGREQAVGGSARGILKVKLNDMQYRQTFAELLKQYTIPVILEHRVSSVQREGTTIKSITLDHAPPDQMGCPTADAKMRDARRVTARVFIDCTYEGDLMARSGVSYTYGRESREEYGESLAGVQPNLAVYNIDPYVKPGDPKSGLLPMLQDLKTSPEGSADKLTMGYGFRWKLSVAPDRIPLAPPEEYDPRQFEMYRRGFQNNAKIDVGRRMRKLDVFEEAGGRVHSIGEGNLARALLAPTNYGSNANYPDGDYPTRARIWKAEQHFMSGMTHFLRTDPVVPTSLKELAISIGFEPCIFHDTNGWPHQLYVREARRMKSAYIITQKDMAAETNPDDSIGLASYGVDEWPYATYPLNGKIALYGGYYSMLYLEEAHQGIYKIPYRAIIPKREECTNLLVPVCVSASHIAMTSIRMEPVWMILGESAGVAAAMAAKENRTVQEIEYSRLRTKLLGLNQRLERPV